MLLYAANVPGASSFSLTATGAVQRVVQVTPAALGNAAPATLRITGAGFEPGTTVTLVGSGNTEYPAASTTVVSYTQLTATFAAGLPPDVYTVRVNQGGNSDSLHSAFTVTAGGSAKLETNLQVPNFLGRHIPATIYITYANAGTVAMPAPLLELVSTDPTQLPLFTLDPTKIIQGLHTSTLPDGYGNTIQILASGKIPGVLLPGESITVPVYYAGLQQPWDFSKNTVSLALGSVQTTDTTPVDWSTLKSSLQPPNVSSLAWNQIFANLTSQLGTTAGQFVAAMDDDAAYLGGLGENVDDIDKLTYFMFLQADSALSPVSSMSAVTDTSLPLPSGETLSFSRGYLQPIASRDTLGILGYGWTAAFQSSISVEADGNVDLATGNGGFTEVFQPDSRGGYFSPDQTLTLTANNDGTHTLLNRDGSVTNYTASGRLASEQDTNGNQITFNYNGSGQLVGATASSGPSLTFAYNTAGRLASVVDSDGRLTTYAYDPTNQFLLSVTGPAGTTSYTYDTASNGLSSIAYPDGTHSFFAYDALARLASTSADGGVGAVTYTYNAGEVTATDADLVVTQTAYDFFGAAGEDRRWLGKPDLPHLRRAGKPVERHRCGRRHRRLRLRRHRQSYVDHRSAPRHDHLHLRPIQPAHFLHRRQQQFHQLCLRFSRK